MPPLGYHMAGLSTTTDPSVLQAVLSHYPGNGQPSGETLTVMLNTASGVLSSGPRLELEAAGLTGGSDGHHPYTLIDQGDESTGREVLLYTSDQAVVALFALPLGATDIAWFVAIGHLYVIYQMQ